MESVEAQESVENEDDDRVIKRLEQKLEERQQEAKKHRKEIITCQEDIESTKKQLKALKHRKGTEPQKIEILPPSATKRKPHEHISPQLKAMIVQKVVYEKSMTWEHIWCVKVIYL